MILYRINRFLTKVTILNFLCLYLIISPIFPNNNLLGQEINNKAENINTISNTSLLNSFCYISATQDTNKKKIIFKQKSPSELFKIELFSSSQFKHLDKIDFIGEKGFNLKKAMGNNIESISMVDKAYRKKSLGKPLIIAGGAVSFIGLVLLEMYVQDKKLSTKPNKSFLWSGLSMSITGCISMIKGFNNHGSLTRNLEKAISVYNNDVIKDTSEKDNEKKNNLFKE